VAGVPEALAAGRELGLEVIGGVELSAEADGRTCHILGYFIDPADAALRAALAQVAEGRRERNPRIIRRLNELGVAITMDQVAAQAGGRIVGRAHIAAALVEAGHVKDAQRAFDRWLARGKRAYVERVRLSRRGCIEVIRGAGGVAALAHPAQLGFRHRHELAAFLDELVACGLGGLECLHPDHSAAQTAFYLQLAQRRGLAVTGGSDFHGSLSNGVRLGVGRGRLCVGEHLLEALRAARPK
jgi:predicted metal-dependent phosphoesterase TrpH